MFNQHGFWFLRAAVLGLAMLQIQCGTQSPWSSIASDAAADKSAGIMEMQPVERARLFGAVSGAVYCGDGEVCTVPERLERNLACLGLNFKADGWNIALTTARDAQKDVEGYVFSHPQYDDVIIAFRGSESQLNRGAFQDWILTNARAMPKHFGGRQVSGQVHQGFLEAMYGIWHSNDTGLLRVLSEQGLWNKRLWLTGHSGGGALAVLVGMRLAEEDKKLAGIFTYGAPKMAAYDFQWSFNRSLEPRTFQFINPADPVPHLPMNLVAVGQNFEFHAAALDRLVKDGAPAWDPLTLLTQAQTQQHSMDSCEGVSYLDSLKAVN